METFKKTLLCLIGAIACGNLQANSAKTPITCSVKDPTFKRGDEMITVCSPSYNPPAQVHLNRAYQGFVTASYLYWNAQQEGMDLATPATKLSGGLGGIDEDAPSIINRSGVNSHPVIQDFSYNSGFKVGLGYNFEQCGHWTLRADYTRLHQRTTTEKSAPHSTTGIGVLAPTDWFSQIGITGGLLEATSLHSSWDLELDWLDLTLSRAFYQGHRFVMIPFASLRTSWISQALNLSLDGLLNSSTDSTSGHSHNHLHSWGIGPRIGIEGRFLLGAGFRLQGELGSSLLFTQYDRVTHSENDLSFGVVSYGLHRYTCLRPMLEMNLGLGWGLYFFKQHYHLDLSATYDFNYLWGQNMMHTLNDMYVLGSSSSYDLSLQGLTVSADFHF